MNEAVVIDVCRSLEPLRDVVSSLKEAAKGHIPNGCARRRVVRRAKAAGPAALPALFRSLCAENECESSWACYLLRRIGGPRVVERVNALLRSPGISDQAKARALGLLADLRAPMPKQVVLRDPEEMLISSVSNLLANLRSRSDLGQAVDLILEQVPRTEITPFMSELLERGGQSALPLLDALIADLRTPPDIAAKLRDVAAREPRSRSAKEAQLLDRALNLLQRGKPARARKHLETLSAAHPDDPDVNGALGVCLLELGLPHLALVHLTRAAEAQPEIALHRWNIASAARSAECMGLCYRALSDYMGLPDGTPGSYERYQEAESFCAAYEDMLKDAYPGVPMDQVLEGEEIFNSAYAALSASRYDEAMLRFREVLQLVPRHYPSWGNLGAAYLALDRREEALHCLKRALELNPNYTIARENLALIEHH